MQILGWGICLFSQSQYMRFTIYLHYTFINVYLYSALSQTKLYNINFEFEVKQIIHIVRKFTIMTIRKDILYLNNEVRLKSKI